MNLFQKSKEDSERDEFINKMHETKANRRRFQQKLSLELTHYNHCGLQSAEGQHVEDKTIESDDSLKILADKASNIDAKVQLLEEEYKETKIVSYLLEGSCGNRTWMEKGTGNQHHEQLDGRMEKGTGKIRARRKSRRKQVIQ